MTKYKLTEDTVEIPIQGGMIAINGMNAVFMVESVMPISKSAKIKRENNDTGGSGKKNDGNSLFADVLKNAAKAASDERREAPQEYRSTVYDRNMVLSFDIYQKREYHY